MGLIENLQAFLDRKSPTDNENYPFTTLSGLEDYIEQFTESAGEYETMYSGRVTITGNNPLYTWEAKFKVNDDVLHRAYGRPGEECEMNVFLFAQLELRNCKVSFTGSKITAVPTPGFEFSFNDDDDEVQFTVTGAGYVDWGDGVVEAIETGTITHNYSEAGPYTVRLYGDITALSGFSAGRLAAITELPEGLLNLSTGAQPLTGLPTLPSTLTGLGCDTCEITALPALPANLLSLVCSFNQLTTLPALPGSLAILRCSGNDLTVLPDLPATLAELNCQGNELTALPTLPAALDQLVCDGNDITTIPALPAGITQLRCTGNQLTALPTLVSTLNYLECQNNQITTVAVNQALADLIAIPVSGGNYNFSTQTPPAPPSGQGITDKGLLQAGGNTVTTD